LIERRLLHINGEIGRLRLEEQLVEGELNMHRHLADDAARDSAVSEGMARLEAREALKDVHRQERALEKTRRTIARLEAKRDGLLGKLGPGRAP
jgi:hypothetical protein